jgi:hypothetical protein
MKSILNVKSTLHTVGPIFLLVSWGGWQSARAQQATATTPTTSTALHYLSPTAVPQPLRGPLAALGNRLQVPGLERLTEAGMYTDSNGSQSIQFTWELPGNVRIDFTGGTSHAVVFNGTSTTATAGTPSPSDDDLIESLADDRTEALLYGPGQSGFSMRFLGERFRTDKGTNKAYAGPFYDISQTFSTVAVRSDKAKRQKLYLFDSGTQLLTKTTYQIVRAGVNIKVDTAYSGWSTISGQAVPGQIVRSENGVSVFTILVKSAQVAPTAADSLFAHP